MNFCSLSVAVYRNTILVARQKSSIPGMIVAVNDRSNVNAKTGDEEITLCRKINIPGGINFIRGYRGQIFQKLLKNSAKLGVMLRCFIKSLDDEISQQIVIIERRNQDAAVPRYNVDSFIFELLQEHSDLRQTRLYVRWGTTIFFSFNCRACSIEGSQAL